MTKRTAVPVALLAALAAACSSGDDADAVRGQLSTQSGLLSRAYAQGNADSVAWVFAPEGLQIPPNGPSVSGRDAIRAYWNEALSWGRWTYVYTPVSVDVAGDHAVELGRYQHSFEPNVLALPGMGPIQESGHYVFHWRHDGAGWSLVVDISTRDEPLSRGRGASADSAVSPGASPDS